MTAHMNSRMIKLFTLILFTRCLTQAVAVEKEHIKPADLPAKQNLHLYLLLGEENMVGRGKISKQDQIPHPRVIMLNKDNMWLPAVDPLHRENVKLDGVGPGLSFGRYLADDDETITIGLIPCAVAGSGLYRWQKGGDCFRSAIERAREGMKYGTLKGIIWHHGEWDGRQRKKAATYGLRLGDVIRDLRSELEMQHLPVVVGKLGTFLRLNRVPYANYVNEGLENIPQEILYTECVHTEKLRRGDLDTFNAESARELGTRYAKLMMDIHSKIAAERRADKLAKFKRDNNF